MAAAVLFLAQCLPTQAAPIDTAAPPIINVFYQPHILRNESEIAPAWLPSPKSRGTLDIIWSCIFTLSLCVYTAIHLNVPPPGTGKLAFFGRKTKWVIIGVLAPELVVYTAWRQLRQARNVARALSELRGEKDGVSYDLSYGFYVAMGGFVTDVSHLHDTLQHATITAAGIIQLARRGQFVDIDARSIADKSKADIFAKGMVMVQLIWLIVNCIGRKIARYPLTLLEIHTCVHVLCALIIYSIWLKKPVDIREPTTVDFHSYPGHLALLLMASPSAFPWTKSGISRSSMAEMDILHYYNHPQRYISARIPKKSMPEIYKDSWLSTTEEYRPDMHVQSIYSLPGRSETDGYLRSGKHYRGIGPGLVYYNTRDLPEDAEWTIGLDKRRGKSTYLMQQRMRLEMGTKVIQRWESIVPLLQNSVTNTSKTRLREILGCSENGDLILFRAKNLDLSSSTTVAAAYSNLTATLNGRHGDMTSGLLLFMLPALYGGIHLFAWNFEFATAIEHKLWKIACLDLVASLPVFLIGSLAREAGTNGKQFTMGDMALISWLGLLFLFVNIPATVVARVYLVLESFISLRRVPVGVYATVPWSDWVPHV